jgi:DNA invertase Pin-like site-specific DNA recombinase
LKLSTTDQDLPIQEAALRAAGCDIIRAEQRGGTTMEGRAELRTVLEFLRPGDTLVVTRIDRRARSMYDLQNIARTLKERGIDVKATEQPIDTSTAASKCFFDILAVFAEFETSYAGNGSLRASPRRRPRVSTPARAAAKIDVAKVRKLKALGCGAPRSPRSPASPG